MYFRAMICVEILVSSFQFDVCRGLGMNKLMGWDNFDNNYSIIFIWFLLFMQKSKSEFLFYIFCSVLKMCWFDRLHQRKYNKPWKNMNKTCSNLKKKIPLNSNFVLLNIQQNNNIENLERKRERRGKRSDLMRKIKIFFIYAKTFSRASSM